MTLPFKKINLPFRKENISLKNKGVLKNGYGRIYYYTLVAAYKIFPPEVFSVLRPDMISWTEVSREANMPHKDYGVMTNINLYTEPQGAVTRFYKPKDHAIAYSPSANFYPNLYRHHDLDFIDSFKAEPYDSYVLDVTAIHEVSGVTDGTRKIIQLSWTTLPMASVLERLHSCNFVDDI